MGFIFLALFAITLFGLYIAVRRSWGTTLMAGGAAGILSVMFVILFALTYEDTSVAQAIFSGFVVGIGFTVVVVITATFFRTNQPSADVKLITQNHEETEHNEQRNDRR